MRLTDEAGKTDKTGSQTKSKDKTTRQQQKQAKPKTNIAMPANTAMAQAFAKLKK